jgi:hypothetical protein
MRHITRAGLAAIVAVPAAAMAGDSLQFSPGRWEETITVTAIRVGGQEFHDAQVGKSERLKFECISGEEATNPEYYFKHSGEHRKCSGLEGTVAAGRIHLTSNCVDPDIGPGTLVMDGTYGRERYEASVKATGDIRGKPFIIDSVVEGRFVGVCRGDEE